MDQRPGRAHEPHDQEATVRRFHYESHNQLRQHLADFVAAYNFARRLKTLRGLTPYEAICKAWTDKPSRFIRNPHHQTLGPNIYSEVIGNRQRHLLATSRTGFVPAS